MRIKATFKGTNGSCGYETGQEYELELIERGMSIERVESGGYCSYGSIKSFLMNWSNIKQITNKYPEPDLISIEDAMSFTYWLQDRREEEYKKSGGLSHFPRPMIYQKYLMYLEDKKNGNLTKIPGL